MKYRLVHNLDELLIRSKNLKTEYLKEILSPKLFESYFEMRPITYGRNLIIYPERGTEFSQSHRDKMYSTIKENIEINFFENWKLFEGNKYFLVSTNFNFKKIVGDSLVDFMCLHSEPNDIDNSGNIYKISPHLHFEFADEPIKHSHIGLFCYELKNILKSFQNYDNAMKTAINMIKTEILMKI